MENKRSFKIIKIESKNEKINEKIGGRYISNDPYDAGMKAFNSILRNNKEEYIRFKIIIKESTRNSDKKEYEYDFSRYKKLRAHNRKIGDKTITYEYNTSSNMSEKKYKLYKIKEKSKKIKCTKAEKNDPILKTCCGKHHTKNSRTFESCKKTIHRNRK
tara:strand:- start:1048 stop:1524 length:477 start_codon:yes stop_codon:yes gene_type:complete